MKKKSKVAFIFLMFCSFFCLFGSLVQATENYRFVSTDSLKGMMDKNYPMTVINTLSPIEFKDLRIKDSINIPSSQMNEYNALLPRDKARLLVFYGKGLHSPKSRESYLKAKDLGYTNIMLHQEGMPGWIRKRYSVVREIKYPRWRAPRKSIAEMEHYKEEDVVVLDIRGNEANLTGDIDALCVTCTYNIINIPLDELEDLYSSLPKNKKYVIIDHAGLQVDICGRFLIMKGYTVIGTMEGGARAWHESRESKAEKEKAMEQVDKH